MVAKAADKKKHGLSWYMSALLELRNVRSYRLYLQRIQKSKQLREQLSQTKIVSFFDYCITYKIYSDDSIKVLPFLRNFVEIFHSLDVTEAESYIVFLFFLEKYVGRPYDLTVSPHTALKIGSLLLTVCFDLMQKLVKSTGM